MKFTNVLTALTFVFASQIVQAGNDVKEGGKLYKTYCAACHGTEGEGMAFVAPNVAEFSPELVKLVLDHGKKGAMGTMPAFNRLNDKQKEAVGAYISSLSN